jgi:hypothetical protein
MFVCYVKIDQYLSIYTVLSLVVIMPVCCEDEEYYFGFVNQ